MANVTFNPALTTNAAGTFNIQTNGYVVGTALQDPAVRNLLSGGIVGPLETIPMWGGLAISETSVPLGTSSTLPVNQLGGYITRATNVSTVGATSSITGFTVFDQVHSMITTPQSPVPQAGSGSMINYYRLGSNARICVQADPALVSLNGTITTNRVSWDWVNQLLVPYLGTLTISSGTYNSTTGLVTLTMSSAVTFSAGDAIVVSSLTGTGAYASLNGTFTALSATGTTVTYQATAALGATTITGGSLTLGSGASSQLPVRVLDVQVGNSMAPSYNATTGFVTWNYSATSAVILI